MTVVNVTPVVPTPIGVSRAGPAGKGWVFADGPPSDDLGRIGDMYLDTDPEGLFNAYGPKLGATWDGAQVYPLGAESAGAIAAKTAAEAAADLAEGHAASAASDKAAVAADRVQTGLDRAAVATAEAAVASDKADVVSAADDAAGSAAAAAADRSVVASDRLAVADHAAQVALDRTAAESAADAADANATQTAADRVQTGLDRAAAEASAAAAATFDPTAYYSKTSSDSRFATAAQGALAATAVQPAGLTKAAVGLGNVDNTSDATKNTAVATLTNKTLTAPVINSPTGLTKADVGLSGLTLASTFTTSGAFAIVLTATGATALTLPPAGTVAVTSDFNGKQTIPLPLASWVARATGGATAFSTELATNDVMLRGFDFSASVAQAVQISFCVPKQWNEGTVSFRIRWTAGSGSGGVAFSLRGRAVSDGDALDGAWGTAVTVTDTLGTANYEHTSAESGAITIGGSPAAGDRVFLELQREVANGSDTLAVVARGVEVEFFLTTDAGTDA